jgi:hypothetical protein
LGNDEVVPGIEKNGRKAGGKGLDLVVHGFRINYYAIMKKLRHKQSPTFSE